MRSASRIRGASLDELRNDIPSAVSAQNALLELYEVSGAGLLALDPTGWVHTAERHLPTEDAARLRVAIGKRIFGREEGAPEHATPVVPALAVMKEARELVAAKARPGGS